VISGRTVLYGVVGHPVGHSLSPAMHNAAFHELAMDCIYLPLPVTPQKLAEALRGAHALGFRGLNVTVPHKQPAAELCLELDGTARACGAANTLRRVAEGWEGFNTDAPACRTLLESAGVRSGACALLLGAGGAALAAAWALLGLGVELAVSARRPEAADELLRRMRAALPGAPKGRRVEWEEAPGFARGADVVVNATSIGMGSGGESLRAFRFRPGLLAVDFVYGDTAFARQALSEGATSITGEQILVRQGALAFTLFTGREAPEAVMAAALSDARR